MPYPYDHPSTLHPFDLAVLNSNLKARGLAPVPGNEQWAAPEREPDDLGDSGHHLIPDTLEEMAGDR